MTDSTDIDITVDMDADEALDKAERLKSLLAECHQLIEGLQSGDVVSCEIKVGDPDDD